MAAGQRLTLPQWALLQLKQLAWLLAQVFLIGAIVAAVTGKLRWRSVIVATVGLVVGLWVWTTVVLVDLQSLRHLGGDVGIVRAAENPNMALWWVGVVLLSTGCGFWAGKVGRRVAFWELYWAVLISALILGMQLAVGFDQLHHVMRSGAAGAMDGFAEFRLSPGERYLGQLWKMTFALGVLGSFVLSVFGGSLAFLFFGARGKLEPQFGFERWISRRHFGGDGAGFKVSTSALVAMVGVALGIATLVTVNSAMTGYLQSIEDTILSTNSHLTVQKYGTDFVEHASVIEDAKAVPGVIEGTPFTFNEALISSKTKAVAVMVKGIQPETAAKVTAIEKNLCESWTPENGCVRAQDTSGMLAAALVVEDGPPALVLGVNLMRKLGLSVGDVVEVTTPRGMTGSQGIAPERMAFRVAGVFKSGMYEFDSHLTFAHIKTAQQLMGMGDTVFAVDFRVENPNVVERYANKVLSAIGRYPYHKSDWREINRPIFQSLMLQKVGMFLVLFFIVIVAAFNIASMLFMSVVEKSREIGVLKSMGARDSSIMKIFVLQGWMVVGVGAAAGVVLGLGLCALLSQLNIAIAQDVYMVDTLRVKIVPLEIMLTVAAAFVISHVATLYPALNAARQAPVDAMRWD